MPSSLDALRTQVATAKQSWGRISTLEVRGLAKTARADGEVSREEASFLRDTFASEVAAGRMSRTAQAMVKREFDASYLAPAVAPAPVRKDLADPAVLEKHRESTEWRWVEGGTAFVDGAGVDDVVQGRIANCYMVASFAAVAHTEPELLQRAIRDNGDGTFTVRFHERSYWGSEVAEVTVDGQQAFRTDVEGRRQYGTARQSTELWVGVLEKAYAQWKGDYETVGNGGSAARVLEALTGRRSTTLRVQGSDADRLFSQLQQGLAEGKAAAAGTLGKGNEEKFEGTRLYAWHAYTVLGVGEEDGERFVTLRNPWGRTEPGSDGKDDGTFRLPYATFRELYANVYMA